MGKRVYAAMSADILHLGQINIIQEGSKYGEVIVGVLSDEAIAKYKRAPFISFEERAEVFRQIKGVSQVVRQESLDYTDVLNQLKPGYVIHGDDWREGPQSEVRAKVIEQLKQWGGELIEVPYTQNISATMLEAKMRPLLGTPDIRRGRLKKLIALKPYVRVIEASNGLSGIIVENTKVIDQKTGFAKEFDAMWISSLCDSTFKGKPDTELVDLTSRLNTINEILEVTTKPIILDGDTGGLTEHFVFNVKTLERIGVSAIIIEDKTGLKKNSLFGTDVVQTQADPDEFAAKITAGKKAQLTDDFMIFARCESLILKKGINDALMRCRKYMEAGADGIMIHSKEKDGKEVFDFMKEFRKEYPETPIIVVPTTYNSFTEEELAAGGANIIIHANHLLRAAYPAMVKTAASILEHGRSLEASNDYCMPIKQVIELIPGGK